MESKNFALSDFASIEGCVDYVTNKTNVKLIKSQFGGKGQAYADLTTQEWDAFVAAVPEIVNTASSMYEKTGPRPDDDLVVPTTTTDGENAPAASPPETLPLDMWELKKMLSQRFMAKLSIYKSPDNLAFITLSVRQYFIDRTGIIRFRKTGGVSLSLKEIFALTAAIKDLQQFFKDETSTTHVFELVDKTDLQQIKQHLDRFWQFGSPNDRCRLLIQKPSPFDEKTSEQETPMEGSDGKGIATADVEEMSELDNSPAVKRQAVIEKAVAYD